ncbi:MAG: hypothetical protein GY714_08035 [Desulfobacterales bacterium]|nr:hypothetical protein [Desulfobacterales bacterium]
MKDFKIACYEQNSIAEINEALKITDSTDLKTWELTELERDTALNNALKMKIADLSILFENGNCEEFGFHDNFFNALVIIEDKKYYFQCCANDAEDFDPYNCGYNDGICGDVNKELANLIGWDNLILLIERAVEEYLYR